MVFLGKSITKAYLTPVYEELDSQTVKSLDTNSLLSRLLKQIPNHTLDRVDFYWNAILVSN